MFRLSWERVNLKRLDTFCRRLRRFKIIAVIDGDKKEICFMRGE